MCQTVCTPGTLLLSCVKGAGRGLFFTRNAWCAWIVVACDVAVEGRVFMILLEMQTVDLCCIVSFRGGGQGGILWTPCWQCGQGDSRGEGSIFFRVLQAFLYSLFHSELFEYTQVRGQGRNVSNNQHIKELLENDLFSTWKCHVASSKQMKIFILGHRRVPSLNQHTTNTGKQEIAQCQPNHLFDFFDL